MAAISVENLTKKYGGTTALDGVNLQVNDGELFGLLGVNGAGKTTLIKILSTLSLPTEGRAFVCGKEVVSERSEVKRLIDLSPQETSVALNLTVRENLKFFAELYYPDRAERDRVVEEIISEFGLAEVIDKRAKTLSGGWQRRLSIAVALVSHPRVLFLDEPTLGLDVFARRDLWKIISKLKGKITVLLTSHYLEEIEALCDRVAILAKGKVVALGTVEELERRSGEKRFEDAFVKLVEEAEAKDNANGITATANGANADGEGQV